MTNRYVINYTCPCGYESTNKEDFNEDELCRNCEEGKQDAQRGHD